MKFGDQQTFLLIGAALTVDDDVAYEEVCKVAKEDINILINKYCKGVQVADKEDMLQDVLCKMVIYLPEFYKNSKDLSVNSRNAWLKSIVLSIRGDYFRKMSKSITSNAIELDEALNLKNGKDFTEELLEKNEERTRFLNALKIAFEINTSPDKLITFVYNKLFGSLSGSNGSPKTIIEKFKGSTLMQMYERMIFDLSGILNFGIPEEVLIPLKEKVDKDPNKGFTMSAHQVADSTNWIMNRIKGAVEK